MRKIKNRHRILLVALCIMFVLGLACPAFAAEVTPFPGHIYAGSITLMEDSFQLDEGKYFSYPFKPAGLEPAEADSCIVKYGSVVRRLTWAVYSGEAIDQSFFVGNPRLIDPTLPDNGEMFVLAISVATPKESYFACSPVFYVQYLEGTADTGFQVHFLAPQVALNIPSLMENVTSVAGSALGMVGDVAQTVSKNAILYLPIVIGLCGIGIALFRRLKQ